ncbi:heavy-metal-associated domain-containing protein [Planctomicrobium piriforme]|uniref:Copper chaperone CopZ n=1 Tax=Planctomicrobium piriforme TaxID=1576369 RepID=A0A1I3B8K1_9PLAN|nr:heavy metal-associated domain-containing protein [Planctomicrobium piriforme]SFH58041.1 Copper chaperone CopZ [Planctomicrobium piriforme]
MLKNHVRTLAALAVMACSSAAFAEEVKLEGVHLCCGSCTKAATKSLTGVTGVSDVKISQDDETIVFQAKDEPAALAGLTALANAGFYGSTKTASPDFAVDPSAKKNTVEISGMHLCCAGCTKSAEAALKAVTGVKSVSAEAKQGKMTVKGDNVSLADTLKALHEAGFHGTVK